MLLLCFAVLIGLLAIAATWNVARSLAWPRPGGPNHGQFVGSWAGATGVAIDLVAYAVARWSGYITSANILLVAVAIGIVIASLHGEHTGVRRATQNN